MKPRSLLPGFCYALLVCAYVFHFCWVANYAVDCPFWDDWCFFPESSVKWIMAFHSEHRVVTTKLLILILYQIDGWNIEHHLILNFVLFGIIVILAVTFFTRVIPGWRPWHAAGFCTFLLSPVLCEVHLWAMCASWHFAILFSLVALLLMFSGETSYLRLIAATIALVFAAYSIATGLVAALAIYGAWSVQRFCSKELRANIPAQRRLQEWLLVSTILLPLVAAYFVGFRRPSEHHSPAMPWTIQFWEYFGVMLQSGFVWPKKLMLLFPLWGLVLLVVLVLGPLSAVLISSRRNQKPLPVGFWGFAAFSFAVISAICMIAVGRGNFPLTTATAGRYTEHSLFLIPIAAGAWSMALHRHLRYRNLFLILLWGGCALLQARALPLFGHYANNYTARTQDLYLLKQYYTHPPEGEFYLPDFWVPLNSYLREAEEKNVSFYRKIALDIHGESKRRPSAQ